MFYIFFVQNKPGNLPRLTYFHSFNSERIYDVLPPWPWPLTSKPPPDKKNIFTQKWRLTTWLWIEEIKFTTINWDKGYIWSQTGVFNFFYFLYLHTVYFPLCGSPIEPYQTHILSTTHSGGLGSQIDAKKYILVRIYDVLPPWPWLLTSKPPP